MKRFLVLALLLGAIPVHAATYVVNSSADTDDGACDAADCTLREAVGAANADPGSTISFAIGSGAVTITLGSSLPAITAATIADATTQPGFAGTPLISITGPALNAFDIKASNVTVRGFELYAIGRAIVTSPAATISGITIDANAIGNASGAATTSAIQLTSVDGASITNNTIDGRAVTIDGILLNTSTSNVVITGNHIVSCSVGVAVVPNAGTGNIRIGGTMPAERNVIGGCETGVFIASGVPSLVVEGNYLGTDESGTVMNGNAVADVRLAANKGAIVQNNVLSASVRGVYGEGGEGSVVRGNLIGLHPDGVTPFSGTGHGIDVTFTTFIRIGGSTVAARNVIVVDGYGVWFHSGVPDFPVIQGNYIGLDAIGTPAGDALVGILIDAGALFSPQVGGVNPGEGNAIGNARESCVVMLDAIGGKIEGNIIGLNALGTARANVGSYGIRIDRDATIGGAAPGARNVISGVSTASANNAAILVTGSSTVSIQGNFIGTDITGSVAIGSPIGIDLQSTGPTNIIDNTISGNASHAIRKSVGGDTTIRQNRIGVDAAGTAALPNGGDGVRVSGGVARITANLIANNGGNGIHLLSSSHSVGTTTPGDGNVIRSNGGAGVLVASGTSNPIVANSIVSNGGLGIDLAPAGVTTNDSGDGDIGANNLQNAPVLTLATTSAGSTMIAGSLNSVANESFTVEFFSSPAADPSGRGEGATFLGRIAVTTDASGDATLSFAAPPVAGGHAVAATAKRDATGDTSEFSNAVVATSPGSFQFSAPTLSVSEGAGGVTLTVTRTGGAGVPASVDYATTDGGAAAGSDYTPSSGTLEFAPAETSKTIVVPVLDDAIDEPGETFTVTLSNASLGAPSQATVTIDDDDPQPSLFAGDASVTEGNGGTTTMTFTVSLSAMTTQQVTIDYTTADDTATGGSDYGARFGTLTFAAGETSKTVAITVIGDVTAEANETMRLLLSSAVNASIADAVGIGTIVNDDGDPSIAIEDLTIIEGNSGTSIAAVLVSLTNPSSSPVTVDYATNGNTATSGGDFVATSGTLTFGAGETTKTIDVTINGDTIVEGNEDLFVDLSNPSNASIGDGQAAITVADDDGSPSLTISNATVNESAGSASITVLLAPASAQTVTVSYATSDGTAAAASDYTATSGTLTFNAGETTKSIVVPIVNDNVNEDSESFDVALSTPSNAGVAGGAATVTIVDDDPTPTISVNDVNATEGTTATFAITLSNPSATLITVNYATANGTASAGDYAGTSGTLMFNAGETSKTLGVPTTQDVFKESDESFVLNLSGATNATISRPQAAATIVDDDGTPSLMIGDASVTEGDAGTAMATFAVTLAGSTAQTVTADYATADGTATAGSDYAATSGHLVFAPGVTTQTLQVPVIGDPTVEPEETFFVNLSNADNALLADNQGLATIANDDVAAVVPSISMSDAAAAEGDHGTSSMTFTVTLSAATTNSVSVQYATGNGTAQSGSDYAASAGTLVFAPGVTSQFITIAVAGDTFVEPDETFAVDLSNAMNATLARPQAMATILNDDASAVVPSISIGNASVPEGDNGTTNATFTVTLSAATTNSVSVHYATANGTAESGSDYAESAGTLVFAPGLTSRDIAIAVAGDTLVEPNETFTVHLASPAGATIADGRGAGTILDDDVAVAPPSLAVAGTAVTEGNAGTANAVFVVTLTKSAAEVVTVDYATSDGTATAGVDYLETHGTLAFSPGQTSRQVVVPVVGDTIVESDETFTLTLAAPAGATLATASATATIHDDDSGQIAAVLVIAGAGPGANGSHFRTMLQLLNPGAAAMTGHLVIHPIDGTAARTAGYALQPGEVREIGAQVEGSGFVTVDLVPLTGDLPEVSMRVYNDAGAAGTSGLTTSVVPVGEAIVSGRRAVLIAPPDALALRYNVGVRALSGGASVSFTLHRASGAVAARATRTLGANALLHIAAPVLFDASFADNDWIECAVSAGSAIVYGSTVDNITQDPSLTIARPLP